MDLCGFGGGFSVMDYYYDLDRIHMEDGTRMHSFGELAPENTDTVQKICVTTDRKNLFESSSKDSGMEKYSLRDNVRVGKF